MITIATEKEIKQKINSGCNSGGNMDWGPMKFTSDVSLPKDDKIAMRGEQITAGQLTGLKTHRNANYATRKEKDQKHGQYAKVSRPKSICIYYESSTLRYLSRTS